MNVKVADVVNKLCEGLGLKQNHLAALLDVSSEQITRIREDEFHTQATTKVMRRLNALIFATFPLLQEPIEPMSILSAIKKPVYEDIHGNLDSVLSAIKQDKYERDLLRIIAKTAFEKIREQKRNDDEVLTSYSKLLISEAPAH